MTKLINILVETQNVKSKNEARRMINGRAIRINDVLIEDPEAEIIFTDLSNKDVINLISKTDFDMSALDKDIQVVCCIEFNGTVIKFIFDKVHFIFNFPNDKNLPIDWDLRHNKLKG